MLKLSTAVTILAWAICSQAGPGPVLGGYQIAALFDASDAVCLGTVLAVHDVALRPDDKPSTDGPPLVRKAFSLSVERCYKGAIEASDTVEYTAQGQVLNAWAGAERGLYFLKRLDQGRFS